MGRLQGTRAVDLTDLQVGSERVNGGGDTLDQPIIVGRCMMRHWFKHISLVLSALFVASCAYDIPPARIGDYVSFTRGAGDGALAGIGQRPLQVGLIVVSDTAAPDAAPNLPEEALVRLVASLQRDIGQAIPVTIQELIPAGQIKPKSQGDWAQFAELGRQRGLDYLVLVVASSTEQEYPVMLFLTRDNKHLVPGFRRDNWALLEFALLDVTHQEIRMQVEGRGWATLDSPTAPGLDQWYPVIYLRPQDRRIWPPTYAGAPITLRVVSFDQAAQQLLLKLKTSWLGLLESEAKTPKAGS